MWSQNSTDFAQSLPTIARQCSRRLSKVGRSTQDTLVISIVIVNHEGLGLQRADLEERGNTQTHTNTHTRVKGQDDSSAQTASRQGRARMIFFLSLPSFILPLTIFLRCSTQRPSSPTSIVRTLILLSLIDWSYEEAS